MKNATILAMPLQIGSKTIRNRVFLAPMSGVTDLPMRRLAYEHGAGMVVAEMVPGAELAKGKHESRQRIRKIGDAVHMVQLAGREPELLAEGARIAEGEGADIVDINMGCPAKKVTGGYCGSALMRDPDLASRLIEAAVEAVSVPVTVKMRLGWDDSCLNAPEIAQRAEMLGAQMVTVHGRTRCQFYKGQANWNEIASVKSALSIPVVVNGDIASIASATEALRLSGADAVMVGRAHYGAPWIAGQIAQLAAGNPANGNLSAVPADIGAYVCSHYEEMLDFYGKERGLRHARKHLGWYIERHAPETGREVRSEVMTSRDPARVISLLSGIFTEQAVGPAFEEAA